MIKIDYPSRAIGAPGKPGAKLMQLPIGADIRAMAPSPSAPTQHVLHRVADPGDPPRELSGLGWGAAVSLGLLGFLDLVSAFSTLSLRSAVVGEGDVGGAYRAHSPGSRSAPSPCSSAPPCSSPGSTAPTGTCAGSAFRTCGSGQAGRSAPGSCRSLASFAQSRSRMTSGAAASRVSMSRHSGVRSRSHASCTGGGGS